jgi:two-component system, OmpR family, response regulator ChvI
MATAPEPSQLADRPAARIMLVDDDRMFLQVLASNLREAGFEVVSFDNPRQALASASQDRRIDACVLDWGMPDLDGFTLFRELRAEGVSVPVVFLTSHGQPIFEEAALVAGAADFVDKSRGPAIIRHRLSMALTRALSPETPAAVVDDEVRVGELLLLRSPKRASWRGQPVPLSRSEFDVVALLAMKAGHDVGYRQIYDAIRGYGFIAGQGEEGYRANVRAMVKRIRRKFLQLDPEFTALHNYPGFGYRWLPDG